MEKILNANKYYKTLKRIQDKGSSIAIVNNKPCECKKVNNCGICDLKVPYSHCSMELSKWLLEEYVEDLKLEVEDE